MVIYGTIKDKTGAVESATVCYSISELITWFRDHGVEPGQANVKWNEDGATLIKP